MYTRVFKQRITLEQAKAKKYIHVLKEREKGAGRQLWETRANGNNKRLRVGPFSGSNAFDSLGKKRNKVRTYIKVYVHWRAGNTWTRNLDAFKSFLPRREIHTHTHTYTHTSLDVNRWCCAGILGGSRPTCARHLVYIHFLWQSHSMGQTTQEATS